jgi:hypothetical protein
MCGASLRWTGMPYSQIVAWPNEDGLRVWDFQSKLIHDCRSRHVVITNAIRRFIYRAVRPYGR